MSAVAFVKSGDRVPPNATASPDLGRDPSQRFFRSAFGELLSDFPPRDEQRAIGTDDRPTPEFIMFAFGQRDAALHLRHRAARRYRDVSFRGQRRTRSVEERSEKPVAGCGDGDATVTLPIDLSGQLLHRSHHEPTPLLTEFE